MKRRFWVILAVIGAVAFGLAVAVASIVPFSSDAARDRLVAALAQKFDADVELTSLKLRVLPTLHAEGDGLLIRHKGRQDLPPLITVEHFAADASVFSLYRHHLSTVRLDGLDIEIPPGHKRARSIDLGGVATTGSARSPVVRTFVIDELLSVDARLAIIPGERNRDPRVWVIHRLRMETVAFDRAMPFKATLTNAVPPGDIGVSGTFGPWSHDEPGDTPLDGRFVFEHADLGVFKGISGILSARGTFAGSLDEIDVKGQTETPAFTIAEAGHPVDLHAQYHAVVDGTNGNTRLERVDASFNNTEFVASGSVVGKHGQPGRTVSLDVAMDRARLEDVLLLAVNAARPPMTGALRLHTAFVIPPGDVDVVQKLELTGRFTIADTRFSSPEVQKKIDELSRRSSGKPDARASQHVQSDFAGTFALAGGTLSIPQVVFNTPGSIVRLSGRYRLRQQTLDFSGVLLMDAKVSETTTGWKSLLLKFIDPLFKRPGGGSQIPIRITGRRTAPDIGIDRSRIFGR